MGPTHPKGPATNTMRSLGFHELYIYIPFTHTHVFAKLHCHTSPYIMVLMMLRAPLRNFREQSSSPTAPLFGPGTHYWSTWTQTDTIPRTSTSPKTSYSRASRFKRPGITRFWNPKTSFWRYFGCGGVGPEPPSLRLQSTQEHWVSTVSTLARNCKSGLGYLNYIWVLGPWGPYSKPCRRRKRHTSPQIHGQTF